jgi:hypothetical protein
MNGKHNFEGYIKYLDKKTFCTIKDFFVEIVSEELLKNKDICDALEEDKYLIGFDKNNHYTAVLCPKEHPYKDNPFKNLFPEPKYEIDDIFSKKLFRIFLTKEPQKRKQPFVRK